MKSSCDPEKESSNWACGGVDGALPSSASDELDCTILLALLGANLLLHVHVMLDTTAVVVMKVSFSVFFFSSDLVGPSQMISFAAYFVLL